MTDYDANDDIRKSVEVAFAAVRQRIADDGPPWIPKHCECCVPTRHPTTKETVNGRKS